MLKFYAVRQRDRTLRLLDNSANIIEIDAENYMAAMVFVATINSSVNDAPKLPDKKRKRVKAWSTGQIHESASEAARSLGVSTSAMTQHLRNPTKCPTVRGFVFSYVKEGQQ